MFCLDEKLQHWLEQRGVSSFYAPAISYAPNATASRAVGRWNSPSFNQVRLTLTTCLRAEGHSKRYIGAAPHARVASYVART